MSSPTGLDARGRAVHDISAPLRPDLVTWPGVVERFERRVVASLDAGDAMTMSQLHLGAHAGTHIDAPCHFLSDGGGIETIATTALMGPVQVIAVPAGTPIITADVLGAADIPGATTRIIARTTNSGWSREATAFDEGYVGYGAGAAAWCVDHGMQLVGIDYLSVEPFDADTRGFPVHHTLLDAGVVVVESLDLAGVEPGVYDLVVLPLLIPGSDGAPARAILLER